MNFHTRKEPTMKKSGIKMTKEYCRYRKSLENLIRTGKQDELLKKTRCSHRDGKGFTITQIRQVDYNRAINMYGTFWRDLGFKEINIKSTKSSKRINNLIKRTRKRDGKVFYSCCSEKKLAFLIPTKVKMVYCYTIIIL